MAAYRRVNDMDDLWADCLYTIISSWPKAQLDFVGWFLTVRTQTGYFSLTIVQID